MSISSIDLIVIIVYLVAITATGLLSAKRITKQKSEDYFLASRSLRWPVIGSALFAANISTLHLIGFAQSGYNDGLVWGIFEWMAIPCLIVLGLILAPFYHRRHITTMPEYFEKRFSPVVRSMVAGFAILAALFIHIGISIYAGASILQQFFGFDVMASILLISVITAIYTVLGGLQAVAITESIQAVLLLAGAFLVTIFGILALPQVGIHTFAQFKAALKPNQLSMLQSHNSFGLQWYAVLLGYPVMGIWYWFTDQTIIQRALAARSERDAGLGPLFTGILKIFPVLFMVLPGVLSYVLFKNIIGAHSEQALPVMINQLVPVGLKGLIAAGLLAALMSTVAAALNSSATLVTIDIYKRLKPDMSDRAQVRLGQLASVIVMILAIAWSTQGNRFPNIIAAANALGSMIAPPISAVFIFGIFWKRGTNAAAVTTMISGVALGVAQFLLDIPIIGNVKLITEGLGIGFMMQAWWSFCLCCAIFVTVSFFSKPPSPEQVESICSIRDSFMMRHKGAVSVRLVALILATVFVAMWGTVEFLAR